MLSVENTWVPKIDELNLFVCPNLLINFSILKTIKFCLSNVKSSDLVRIITSDEWQGIFFGTCASLLGTPYACNIFWIFFEDHSWMHLSDSTPTFWHTRFTPPLHLFGASNDTPIKHLVGFLPASQTLKGSKKFGSHCLIYAFSSVTYFCTPHSLLVISGHYLGFASISI